MIIVSIVGPTMREALRQMHGAGPHAHLFEFRIDLIRSFDMRRLRRATRKPVVVTCRPQREGGAFSGTERERMRRLHEACDAGAQYVDIEVKAFPLARRYLIPFLRGTRVVASLHEIGRRRTAWQVAYRRLCATGADVIKYAYPAYDAADISWAISFLQRAKRDGRRAIAIPMGEAGEAGRILYRKFGGWATYAAADEKHAAAPGQIPARTLAQLYRADRLTASTRVFGVIGNPLRQSKGIYVHNRLYPRGRMNAVYCRFPVANLGKFLRRIAPLVSGFSVTIPHKEDVIRYCDGIDGVARAIGAVNTVTIRGGRFHGTNTDAAGALDAIERVLRVRGKRMLVIGAGGAARAIVFEAQRRGGSVTITNRTGSRARRLAREFGCEWIPLPRAAAVNADIVANATSVGMVPNVALTPLPAHLLRGKVVFDAVYNPAFTRLLRDARRMGCRVVTGTEMYINQAARQVRLFTGRRADVKAMRRILLSLG
jgi:3-dehydroquinate dehydratase/shikimate dehydrogenase